MTFKLSEWEIENDSQYDQFLKDFGAQLLSDSLISRFEKLIKIPLHPWILRGIFFSHRNLEQILDAFEAGKEIFIYTGRGPTFESMGVGHLVPFIFTKWLQDVFKCYVIIQISDDEKFYFKDSPFAKIYQFGYENAKDIIAVGFDPEKTFIFSNRDYRFATPEYETLVTEMNKHVSFHMLSKIFGFKENANVGEISWPIYQTAAAFYQAYPRLFSKEALCLVSYGMDQDPYIRFARDIAKDLTTQKVCVYILVLTKKNEKITFFFLTPPSHRISSTHLVRSLESLFHHW
jgi:tryptophanyl-tRNA synthetase